MATSITYAEVINGFDTAIPEAQVDLLIAVVDEADACLDANNVPSSKQKLLKLTAVRHSLTLMGSSTSGKGAVTSESAPSGASRSYKAPTGMGLESTSYGQMLKQLDSTGCIVNLLENQSRLAMFSIGRGACRA